MPIRSHPALLTRLALMLSVFMATLALAQAPESAKPAADEATLAAGEKVAEEGREAYRAGRYADAIGLFDKAFALSAKPAYLYNIARAKEKLADYAGAIQYLEKYLEK